MLVYNSLLCVAIAFSYWTESIFAAEDDEDSPFGSEDQLRVIQLGSAREENLNCFLQLDQFLATKWTTQLKLGANSTPEETISVITTRLKEEEDDVPAGQPLIANTRIMLDGLGTCMSDITKDLKNPALKKCMEDLVSNEIENDGFISLPGLFDNTLPLPFLTFLDVRELAKVLYQNRTWEELSPDEVNVFQKASEYLKQDKSGRDKVFVLDQACEWKNLAALQKLEEDFEGKLEEFKEQVIKSILLRVANGFFAKGDLKPGTWITVYKRWAPVRLQNLKDLESMLEDLKSQKFTTEQLCRYATTLGNFFAEQELKILLPEIVSPLHLTTGDLEDRSKSKEARLCRTRVTTECQGFRTLKKSYEEDLRCMKSFGELLSNHILYSIIAKYADIEPRITYPEIVCKKSAPPDKLAVRYCRCVGSFCTFRDVGEIMANSYKLTDGVVARV